MYTSEYERDYRAVLPEALALTGERVVMPRSGVSTISAAVFVKLEALAELRPRVVPLAEYSMHEYDQVGPRARALCFADWKYQSVVAPVRVQRAQLHEVSRAKKLLVSEYNVLVARRVLHRSPADGLVFTGAPRNRAYNVCTLVVYFRQHWHELAPHTRLTLDELGGIERTAEHVHSAYVARTTRPREVAEAQDTRLRIYTLVRRSIQQIERAVDYLCKPERDRYVPDDHPHLTHKKPRSAPPHALPER